jgi:hypothetical protein
MLHYRNPLFVSNENICSRLKGANYSAISFFSVIDVKSKTRFAEKMGSSHLRYSFRAHTAKN